MKRKNKLPQNFDSKVLVINHIGSKGEGVSYLHTEFNYKEKEYNFFVPFSLPNETIIARPTHFSSEGIRAEIIEIKESSIDRICLLYTSPSPRDVEESRMPSSA